MKQLFAYLAAFAVSLFTLCSYTNRINKEALSSDFKIPTQVLLVAKRTNGIGQNRMNRALESAFKKNYVGKYEFASIDDISTDAKYKDIKIYRYVLLDDATSGDRLKTTTIYPSGKREISYSPHGYHLDYHLYDRLLDSSYTSIEVASNVPENAMTRVAEVLNQQLEAR